MTIIFAIYTLHNTSHLDHHKLLREISSEQNLIISQLVFDIIKISLSLRPLFITIFGFFRTLIIHTRKTGK